MKHAIFPILIGAVIGWVMADTLRTWPIFSTISDTAGNL